MGRELYSAALSLSIKAARSTGTYFIKSASRVEMESALNFLGC